MQKKERLFMNQEEVYKYRDILDLPRHISKTHPPMPIKDRAAQFAPFAALTGHHEAVKETARLTGTRIELDEYCKAAVDRTLQMIRAQLKDEPEVLITYFIPDKKKTGGSYETVAGYVKKIDEYRRILILTDGTRIPFNEIIEIERK